MSVSNLALKRIYEPASDEDGQRVLVDRLWPRGLSKEKAHLALWLKEIAPSNELRQWFHHEVRNWDEFQERYRAELAGNEAAVRELEALLKKGKVTLLYGAQDEEHNQARVLCDYLASRGSHDHA
jgi:uncharacterized protein YeaO (DUF488 family)